jgi:tetratricopeptide (TPR) repeat protein
MADTDSTKKNMSRQQRRDLDIEIGFLEGVVKRDRRNVEALQLLGDDYTQRGRYEEGLNIDRRLARLCPGDPLVQYNLACSFSLTAEHRKAANALRKAIQYGYRDFEHLRRDTDLAPLRKQPVYAAIEKEIAQLEAELG